MRTIKFWSLCCVATGLSTHLATASAWAVVQPCVHEDLSAIAPTPNVDFATQIQPILNGCQICHGLTSARGGLSLDSAHALANLLNVPSTNVLAGMPRVSPGDLANSFLFQKLNCTNLDDIPEQPYGERMPAHELVLPPYTYLSLTDQALFRDWIVQLASPPTLNLGGYLSGNWSNPAQGGHGFQFEFTNQADGINPSQNELVAIWFVYAPDGSGQNWIYAQGPYDSTNNSVTVPATIFHGAKFPFPAGNFDPNSVQGSLGDWGSLTLSFADCNNGTASWTSSIDGYGSGTMPIQRVTSIAGTSCPQAKSP